MRNSGWTIHCHSAWSISAWNRLSGSRWVDWAFDWTAFQIGRTFSSFLWTPTTRPGQEIVSTYWFSSVPLFLIRKGIRTISWNLGGIIRKRPLSTFKCLVPFGNLCNYYRGFLNGMFISNFIRNQESSIRGLRSKHLDALWILNGIKSLPVYKSRPSFGIFDSTLVPK